MGGYIRMDKDLGADPRLLELADELMHYLDIGMAEGAEDDVQREDEHSTLTGFSGADARMLLCNAMLGGLVHLWTYADVHIRSDDTLPLSRAALAQVMRLPDWVVRMYPSDWLVDIEEGAAVKLPGYCLKNDIVGHEERRENKEIVRQKWREQKQRQRQSGRKKRVSTVHLKNVHLSTPMSGGCPPPTGTGTVTNPVTGTERADVPPASTSCGELASAQGASLAVNRPGGNGNGGRMLSTPAKPTEPELEGKARRLATAGFGIGDIVKALAQFGVEAAQVTAWLANALGSQLPG